MHRQVSNKTSKKTLFSYLIVNRITLPPHDYILVSQLINNRAKLIIVHFLPEPCAAGTYENVTTTMVECIKCEGNKISSEGSDSCRKCPANSGESANEQHTQCGKFDMLMRGYQRNSSYDHENTL